MKITLVMVASVDGKTTKWAESGIYEWTSKEDREYFFSLIQKSPVIIMGRKTFDAARKMMRLSPEILRIVITRDPDKYEKLSVPGQLEFTSDASRNLIERLESRGMTEALLVGGEQINTSFFKEGLVTEVWLTIEPLILGSGNSLVLGEEFDIALRLQSVERLNERGTTLMKYLVE
jgi:dihydrofolate reductase